MAGNFQFVSFGPTEFRSTERARSISRTIRSALRLSPAQHQNAHAQNCGNHRSPQNPELDLHRVALAHAFKRQRADEQAHREPDSAQRAHAEELGPIALGGQLGTGKFDEQLAG